MFLFLIFGFRRRGHSLGVMMRACGTCGRVTPQAISMIRTWFTLFFIPVIPLPGSYRSQCRNCASVQKIPRQAAAEVRAAFESGQAQQTAAAVQTAITPPANPPAGWYPDPQYPGAQRWWDGKGWGPTQAEVAPPAVSPALPTSSAPSGAGSGAVGGEGGAAEGENQPGETPSE